VDANVFPVLIDIMKGGDFKTRKEAVWAVVNATSGGSPEQIRYLVSQGAIPPLCDFLTTQDVKIIQVALNGLENILKVGDADAKATGDHNPFAVSIESCYGKKMFRLLFRFPFKSEPTDHLIIVLFTLQGLDKIEFLQSHENMEIYRKAFDMIEAYFGTEEEDVKIAPGVDPNTQEFQFGAAQPSAFQF